MLARLFERLLDRKSQTDIDAQQTAELHSDGDGTLTIRPLQDCLGVRAFQHALNRVRQTGCEGIHSIRVDFSRVRELVGPWGAHLAALIVFGQDLQRSISMIGLHGQPASVTWLFRDVREVQQMINNHAASQN